MRLAAAGRVVRFVFAFVLPSALATTGARADDPPANAERLRSAASEYDAGRRAFGERDYDGAATHFENAFHDAANASALRSAIRARRKAGQLARAATLSALAASRYPKDAATMAVVREVLKESHVKLDRVTLRCTPDCGVAADGRAITVEDGPEAIFYVEPGEHALVVSWSADRNKTSPLTATAGGEDSLSFEAPPIAPPPAPIVQAPPPPPTPPPSTKPFSPIFFYSGVGLTAAALAVTVWSGVDAENNPGSAAVKRDCVGLGPSCPQYQQGLSAQLRTNVLIGTTAVLASATGAIGIFFTRWSGGGGEQKAVPPVEGSFTPLPGGGAFALRGSF